MIKVTQKMMKINNTNELLVAGDVSKEKIDFFWKIPGKDMVEECSSECPNRRKEIGSFLHELQEFACKNLFSKVLLVVESTGGYEKKLIDYCLDLNISIKYINTEAVAKFRVIKYNDTGKTDPRDAKLILSVAQHGKHLAPLNQKGSYKILKELTHLYDIEAQKASKLKNQIYSHSKILFSDFSFSNDFLFKTTGRALLEKYSLSPDRILSTNYDGFVKNMKSIVKRVRWNTLERLWEDAINSRSENMDRNLLKIYESRILELWEDYQRHENRKKTYHLQIVKETQKLQKLNPAVPRSIPGVLTDFGLGRILGMTGSMKNYKSKYQLWRIAGLNIRERKSGTSLRGRDRISKKGNSLLRKIVHQEIMKLVQKKGLYGEYYSRKVAEEGMMAKKALVAVQRKYLNMIFGLSKSEKEFNKDRAQKCFGEFKKTNAA